MYKKFPIGIAFFPVLFSFMEAVYHISVFKSVDAGLLFAVLFSIVYGLLAFALTSFKKRLINKIILTLIMIISTAYFGLQVVYYNIFKVNISVYSISQNAGDATEFWKEALHGILASTPQLILVIIVPVAAAVLMTRFGFICTPLVPAAGDASLQDRVSGKDADASGTVSVLTVSGTQAGDPGSDKSKNSSGDKSSSDSFADDIPEIISKAPVKPVSTQPSATSTSKLPMPAIRAIIIAGVVVLYIGVVFSLKIAGTEANSPYDLYRNSFVLDLGVEKLGIMTSAGLDVKQVITDQGSSSDLVIDNSINMSDMRNSVDDNGNVPAPTGQAAPTPMQTADGDNTPGNEDGNSGMDSQPTASPSPTPTPVDTSPNVLNIDFAFLAENESKKEIKNLHEYFANAEPTNKNEYTGMFKGYNLIYLCCEGYSPWAVDENVTPTLYKLTHSGFIFNNFYNPIWYTSTSDGEYVQCMGLLPYSSNSFKRSKNNALPFCFGWQFLKLGYSSHAYHGHTATYYGRNETHPNLGYIFKAKKAGLEIKDVWPESDLEMIQSSLPDYINDEHFHAYYMTVSGHLEYSFNDNYQARKNMEAVDSLPYSTELKAYIACNVELDKALAYLIEELEKAGKLDNTVIAFGADHYPYGLSDAAIDEAAGGHIDRNFELYRNNFVIWNSQIEEPIVIDKYCSSLDMMPTLSNLFGLEYDSRLFMGVDILSDSPALVIFNNQSFITDLCKYNSKTHEVTMLQDVELPEDYIKNVNTIVKNKYAVSKSILLNDYYRYLLDYIPGVVTEVPPDD